MDAERAHEDLGRRLERVEREVRRWRRGGAAAVALAVVLVFTGQAGGVGGTVDAECFALRDHDGLRRAELKMLHGAPHLTLFDGAAQPRLDLTTGPDGTSTLAFLDAEGRARTGLTATAAGAATLTLGDGARTRVVLTADGAVTSLRLVDADGDTGANLLVRDGIRMLAEHDGEGRIRQVLGIDADGDPSLVFYDAERRRIGKVGPDRN